MHFSISYAFVCLLCLTIVVQHCPLCYSTPVVCSIKNFLKNLKNCYYFKIIDLKCCSPNTLSCLERREQTKSVVRVGFVSTSDV